MNTTQLSCFIEVAQHLNFAKAAEILHMSQPAVSKQIKSLENELKVRLFERDTRNVSLTVAGRHFFPDAKGILTQEKMAVMHLENLEKSDSLPLIIGNHGMEVFGYMAEVLRGVMVKMPHVRPDIIFAPYQSLSTSLQSNTVDIIIGTKEMLTASNSMSGIFRKLADAPICCMSCGEIPESDESETNKMHSGSINISEFSQEFAANNFSGVPRISCTVLENTLRSSPKLSQLINRLSADIIVCDNMEAALCLVRAGAGFMIMPDPVKLHRNDLNYIQITGTPVFSYGYCCNNSNSKPALKLLCKELKNYFQEERGAR